MSKVTFPSVVLWVFSVVLCVSNFLRTEPQRKHGEPQSYINYSYVLPKHFYFEEIFLQPMTNNGKVKSLESWIWDAACSIRGAQDAAKFKDYILPLIFVKRLCDVFDDEVDRIAEKVKTRTKALQLVERDKTLVRFYLPLKPADPETEPTWNVIRKLSTKIGQGVTDAMRKIANENKSLQGIIDRVDFNATTHSQRDIDDDRLSNLIEKISQKRLGLKDVEADIIGRSYEYLIRKFAEGSGQSAGEFYTPAEVGLKAYGM